MVDKKRSSALKTGLEKYLAPNDGGTGIKTEINRSKYHSEAGKIKKRHWVLGTLLILSGSWITHTTTATIAPAVERASDSLESLELTPTLIQSPLSNEDLVSSAKRETAATASLGAPDVAIEEQQEALSSQAHKIKNGESLGLIFKKYDISPVVAHNISNDKTAKSLISIRSGKILDLQYSANNELKKIIYPINALEELVVELDGNEVVNSEIVELEYQTIEKSVSAQIDSSLYLAAQEAGLSNNLIMEMVRIFGWDIDFVQDIRKGDQFHILFTENVSDGEYLSDGHILAAEFTTQGETFRAYRFEDQQGNPSYYNEAGDSMLGTFLRSPVEFSRISSRFGKRKHPISKKWKAHKGVDYAASRGTPIRATADGNVVSAGRKGGYGKTVVLRHAGRFSTLYAHMNGYAKGIRSGARVKQGQTIGYVGSTGMSTGPHLHYEFRVDGVHRNPLSYKTPKASSVSEANKDKYQEITAGLSAKIGKVKNMYMIAKSSQSKTSKL